jgi:site-specific DNA-cytosine methylase
MHRRCVVDLFAGIGGFSTGAAAARAKVILAVEADPKIAERYTANHPRHAMKVQVLGGQNPTHYARELRKSHRRIAPGSALHLHASPPCQQLSQMNMLEKRRSEGLVLVKWYLDVVDKAKPDSWSMEQVPERGLRRYLEGRGVPYTVVWLNDLGLPQSRKRLVAGSADMISRLAAYKAPVSLLPCHVLPKLRPLSRYRLQKSNKNKKVMNAGSYVGFTPIQPGEGSRSLREPAPTITSTSLKVYDTRSKQFLAKRLGVEDCAKLQGFPSTYDFGSGKTLGMKMVANAVPPVLAEVIMRCSKT